MQRFGLAHSVSSLKQGVVSWLSFFGFLFQFRLAQGSELARSGWSELSDLITCLMPPFTWWRATLSRAVKKGILLLITALILFSSFIQGQSDQQISLHLSTLAFLGAVFATVSYLLSSLIVNSAPALMRAARSFCIAFFFLCASLTFAQVTPDLEQGMKPYGSYHGGDLDHISLSNGNLFFHADLMTYSERGDLLYPIVLQYNGENLSLFQQTCSPAVKPGECPIYEVFGPPWVMNRVSQGNSVTIGPEAPPRVIPSGGPGLGINTSLSLNGNPIYVQLYSVLTSDGSLHPLVNTNAGQMTIDGSGFSTASGALTDRHGNKFGNVAEDRNGNQINFSNGTDTLGRQIPLSPVSPGPLTNVPASTASLSSCPSLGYVNQAVSYAYMWDLPTTDGVTLPLTLCYTSVYVNTSSGDTEFFHGVHESFLMLQSVVLPDKAYWAFQYDAGDPNNSSLIALGDLLKITLPTGGSLSYTWATCPCSGSNMGRAVTARTVDANDGTGPKTWHYTYSYNGSGTPTMYTTVTDPLGDDTVHTLTGLGGFLSLYETKVQYFQGSQTSGALLKTITTDYQYTSNPYGSDAVSSGGGTSESVTNIVPVRLTTTLANGLVKKEETDYDASLAYHGPLDGITWNDQSCTQSGSDSTPVCWYTTPTTNGVTNYSGTIGSALAKREYDWGQGAPGPLLRQAVNNYLWQNNSNYLTFNFLDLVSTNTVYDGSGNKVAQTTYGYDEYPLNFSGVGTQFNSSPVNGVVRGNQTSVHRWLNGSVTSTPNCAPSVSNGFLVSYAQYNDTGTVYQATDACGTSAGDANHTTTHSYSSTYVGAYPTQTCKPTVNGVAQCVSGTYDFNTGLLTSFSDANGQTTTYSYDNRWRITKALFPADPNGQHPETDFNYPSATEVDKSVLITAGGTPNQSSANFDGLGRTIKAIHNSANNTTVVTSYDPLGRVASVTNPYISPNESTYGVTQYAYDALGRATQTTKQDGSITASQYDLISGNENCTLNTDEAGKQRRNCVDGLGRLVEVDEPQASSVATSATASVTISGSLQSNSAGSSATAASGTPIVMANMDDVYVLGSNEHVYEYYDWRGWWSGYDVTSATGAATAGSGTQMRAYYDSSGRTYVFYVGSNGHLEDVYFNGSWNTQDLTNALPWGVVPASTTPISMAGAGDFYYMDSGGNIYEITLLSNGTWAGWSNFNVTYVTGATHAASSSPITAYRDSSSYTHVLYAGSNQHLERAYYNVSAGNWQAQDLTTTLSGSVQPASNTPIVMASAGDFYYVDSVGNLREITLLSNESWAGWSNFSPTYYTGAPQVAAGSQLAAYQDSSGRTYVLYVGTNNHLEVVYYSGGWYAKDLTSSFSTIPPAITTPIIMAGGGDFYYFDSNGHVYEVNVSNGSWQPWSGTDLTYATGAAAAASNSRLLASFNPSTWTTSIYDEGNDQELHRQWCCEFGNWTTLNLSADAAGATDSGTVSLTVGSFTATVCFGDSSSSACSGQTKSYTSMDVAAALANAINNSSSSQATATVSGSTINLTWKVPGPFTPAIGALSTTHDNPGAFPNPSFTSPAASFANGTGNLGSSPYVTLYRYDTLGNLLRIDQKGTAPSDSSQWRTRLFTYDSLSRLLTAYNPESGLISYSYDANGNLLHKTSPAPNQTGTATQTISYCYDLLNRITGKQYASTSCPLSSPAAQYFYDQASYGGMAITNGVGQLTGLTDQAGVGAYSFDALGRMSVEQRTIAGITKSMSYSYYLDNSLNTLTYPSGALVTYTSDQAGRMVSAVDRGNNINYVTNATYFADILPAGYVNGNSSTFNGITNSFGYNRRLQPITISATAPNQTVFSIGYDFHAGQGDNGNVYAVVNYRDQNRNESFTYDALNRLTSAQNAGTDCTQKTSNNKTEYWGNSYGYDAWGNLTQKVVTKCSAETLNEVAYLSNQLHTISGSDNRYDAAGNMIYDATTGLTYTYDAENRIIGAGGYTYTYDADGNRVDKSNGSTGTIYWYMSPGIVGESDLTGALRSEYVFFAGKRLARRDLSANAVSYYFSDNLKSAAVITDSAGNIKADSDYYPWGGELQFVNSDINRYKFTGKERDSETGLDYFGARYYGNWLGRFLQVDPKPQSAHPLDPQTWNRYAYVTNRPIIFIDLDGREKFLVVYVEQPQPGTRKRQGGAVGDNVGHSFIGLRDTKTHKEVKVGFYPKGGTGFAVATGKSVPGAIKNNDEHTFNIEKDYRLTDKQFQTVVDSVKQDAKNPPDFNLYNYNCTDWTIEKASLVGITLPSNTGGRDDPNNPADLGQDLSWRGASPIPYEGPESGSFDAEDPQKTSDLTPLYQLPSSDQQGSNATKKDQQ